MKIVWSEDSLSVMKLLPTELKNKITKSVNFYADKDDPMFDDYFEIVEGITIELIKDKYDNYYTVTLT